MSLNLSTPVSMKNLVARSLPLFLATFTCIAGEWTGNLAIQARHFLQDPLIVNSQQHSNYLSVSAEPEYYISWGENQSFTFTPFVRLDQYDDERSHGDIREMLWLGVFDGWELKAGISKVFWGVTESQHLVDVINQTDNVENVDGEDKLGQPMVKLSIERNWGLVDLFILPYFRERNFPGIEGRPRSYPVVDSDSAFYESSDEQNHIDYAGRIFSYLGNWELGLSYFNGTSREPTFDIDPSTNRLIPFYRQMDQWGIDAQITTAEWLWKLEAIKRNWSSTDFTAVTAGLEYTFIGIFNSSADLGLVVEYLYDDRNENASSLFQNDVLTGLRYTLNDAQSTEALLGFIVDLDNDEILINLEASRRLSQHWTVSLEIRGFQNIDSNSQAFMLRQDDLVQLEAGFYF